MSSLEWMRAIWKIADDDSRSGCVLLMISNVTMALFDVPNNQNPLFQNQCLLKGGDLK
jgi:hypothetical protein